MSEEEASIIKLQDLAAAITLTVGSLSLIAYAYSAAFVYALEPRFLSAFSVSDLIFLSVSSLSGIITFVAIGLPIILYATISTFYGVPDGPQRIVDIVPAKWRSYAIYAFVSVVCTGLLGYIMSITSADVTIRPVKATSSIAAFLFVFGITRPRAMDQLAVPLSLIIILVTAFIAGDTMGRRDVASSGANLPCAFLKEGAKQCLDVILIGSDSVVLRRDKRVSLFPRGEIRIIVSRVEHKRAE